MEKGELRRSVKEAILALGNEKIRSESEKVCTQFLREKEFLESDAIFSYMALKNELDPLQISLEALKKKKTLLLPVALPLSLGSPPCMEFYLVSEKDFKEQTFVKSSFGIREPNPKKSNRFFPKDFAEKKMCALVPALAFSKNGDRLGRGAGYYDFWLERFRRECKKYSIDFSAIGICLSVQVLHLIPSESHDQKVDRVIFAF